MIIKPDLWWNAVLVMASLGLLLLVTVMALLAAAVKALWR